MFKNVRAFLLTFVLTLMVLPNANAASSNFPRTMVSARQATYSGEKGRSMAESTYGYNAGISVFIDGAYFAPYVGVFYGAANGRQKFQDGTDLVQSTYSHQYGSIEAGFHLYPIERDTRGINIFLSGAGLLGYHSMALAKTQTFSKISNSDQGFSNGYLGGVGVEFIFKTASYTSNSRWCVTTEVGFKKENTVLFGESFNMDAMLISLGLSW